MSKKKRDRIDIYYHILESLMEKDKIITKIAGGNNLNNNRARKYLNNLKENKLVKEGEKYFEITEKGEKAYEKYKKIRKMIGRE